MKERMLKILGVLLLVMVVVGFGVEEALDGVHRMIRADGVEADPFDFLIDAPLRVIG